MLNFKKLPDTIQNKINDAWELFPGQAMVYQKDSPDPCLLITGIWFGNILVMVEPKRGCWDRNAMVRYVVFFMNQIFLPLTMAGNLLVSAKGNRCTNSLVLNLRLNIFQVNRLHYVMNVSLKSHLDHYPLFIHI